MITVHTDPFCIAFSQQVKQPLPASKHHLLGVWITKLSCGQQVDARACAVFRCVLRPEAVKIVLGHRLLQSCGLGILQVQRIFKPGWPLELTYIIYLEVKAAKWLRLQYILSISYLKSVWMLHTSQLNRTRILDDVVGVVDNLCFISFPRMQPRSKHHGKSWAEFEIGLPSKTFHTLRDQLSRLLKSLAVHLATTANHRPFFWSQTQRTQEDCGS